MLQSDESAARGRFFSKLNALYAVVADDAAPKRIV